MPQESNCSCDHSMKQEAPNSRIVYRGFVTISEEQIPTDAGSYPYTIVHTKPLSVIVLPISQEGWWLVTKEWRHAVKRNVYSFPGGLINDGETPLAAGQRELLEETGYTADRWEPIGTCFPWPGLLDQQMTIMVAYAIHQSKLPTFDGVEKISHALYSVDEMHRLLTSSSDIDAMGLAALGMYGLHIWSNKRNSLS